jgi:hypothetical protein
MASAMMRQTCAKCNKSGGIATCNGCQQSFCIKHFVEHRQELSQQMDNIGQEHDLLRRDMNYEKNTPTLFAYIDQWEQESIRTIQAAAKKARVDLQQLLDQTKNELKISVHRLTEELRTCRESDDYTEIDINKWTEQLQGLRQIIENPSNINIGYENNATSAISLIKVSGQQQPTLFFNQNERLNENNHRSSQQYVTLSREKFADVCGDIRLSADGLTGLAAGNRWDGSCVSGIGRYSSKIHPIRFRIENKISHFLFFGIITASQKLISSITEVKSAYGWWDFGFIIVNGKGNSRDQTKIISSGDEITMILDCDNRQIQLEHHRTKKIGIIPVDLEQCPFPWKIVIRLDFERDCIQILP